MLTSIATVSLSGDLQEKLDAIAAAGFDGVEIFENDLLSFDGSPADVGKTIRDLGLKLVTFQPFRDFEGMPEPQRTRAFERAERKFDLMEELGTDLLMVCSNVSPQSLGGLDRAAKDLAELGDRAAKRGLRIAFEALSWGKHISDYRDSWEVVRRANHPNVGLVLDTFHIIARKVPLDAISSIPGDKIFLVQVADAPTLEMDPLSWSRHFRCFPGQGDFPLGDFMRNLAMTGYDGPLSLEIFNDQFRSSSTKTVAKDGLRSLIYLGDGVEGVKVGEKAAILPPKAHAKEVAFVEFAVEEDTAEKLATLLAGLGFEKRGSHKSKVVSWWKQGDINLVINCDKDGFAHSYNIVHGPSVCAVGLKVDDAKATLDRAQSLLAAPFSQAVGEGEIEMPAIRGVGGSLVYFLDDHSELSRIWDVEFDSAQPATTDGAKAKLRAVDHVSYSMQYEEMLAWVLYFTSIFDLGKMPTLDIPDPGGLVQSQVVQSDALRLILNGSQSPNTQHSQFLNEFFGSGVQHLAFSSDDIFETVAFCQKSGVEILPIPENYYDDIEARFGLEPQLLDRLRAGNILYDRDDEGEYYQAYTKTFANRFFFELVERRAYRGFGAANAPIRLASQTRMNRRSDGAK
ncbi:bifunctional sugar phosphate isomerase/epimerase/4-hydroxyphenylpyruvate dioxygenase family protein [Thalassospira lucentensis]|uniref:3-dehydroshikimate dehydratase n=1 Tax=Thalassospira lucentensis TaxID=168935 RepID=A0A358HX36_9PROT|nr:sugar phosphate isomerase/epimerase and 4-hydroxyphenylpyruvate domain-containing protein [Thalassospira lucentensis]HBU99721.1 3-keto-5-aminohexanoate cleavage protein [Thalassospira lucentensis]HCW69760.1 3-keto-5-aminohexanoate cleavage protein [Thalassospira lucentensis]|tara:strand:+ start:925 stop:2802 length:1878 start_codon:yes stop_codon:yes gene_type:complete